MEGRSRSHGSTSQTQGSFLLKFFFFPVNPSLTKHYGVNILNISVSALSSIVIMPQLKIELCYKKHSEVLKTVLVKTLNTSAFKQISLIGQVLAILG